MDEKLMARSGGKCELCQKEGKLVSFKVTPEDQSENTILICESLVDSISKNESLQPNDWRFLTESVWSEIPAVQVLSWRLLNRLSQQGEIWASDTLESLYLDEEIMTWAQKDQNLQDSSEEETQVHKDSNGQILLDGDSVVLTKTLDVKGSSISAKLGTVVKNIRLVADNPEQIEGRVEGQLIVILTKYLRKQN